MIKLIAAERYKVPAGFRAGIYSPLSIQSDEGGVFIAWLNIFKRGFSLILFPEFSWEPLFTEED